MVGKEETYYKRMSEKVLNRKEIREMLGPESDKITSIPKTLMANLIPIHECLNDLDARLRKLERSS